jgi:dTDP-4-amino-4,6-dideoxygalactose transaminase
LQFRASEIMGAILGAQLTRLDGILADLRRIGRRFDAGLKGLLVPLPSHDPDGDCRTVAAYRFDDESTARAFASSDGVGGFLPIDTGRHIYAKWDALIQRRTSHHPEWDALNHPKNRLLQSNYSTDMCPRTLDWLARTVYIPINPDWTNSEVDARIAACREAAIQSNHARLPMAANSEK